LLEGLEHYKKKGSLEAYLIRILVESWKFLEEILPMDRLLIPFPYSNGAYYAIFHYSGAQPYWVEKIVPPTKP